MIGREIDDAVPRACRTPRRSRGTARTSRTCAAAGDRGPVASCSATRSSACSSRSSPRAAPSAGSSCRTAATLLAQRSSTASSTRRRQLGVTGLIWARRRTRRRSARSKALGEDDAAAGCSTRAGAATDDLLLMAAGEPDATSKLLGQLRLHAREEGRACSTRTQFEFLWVVDFPLLEWDAEDEALVLDAPPVHLAARRGRRQARQRSRRRCAPRPTTWC